MEECDEQVSERPCGLGFGNQGVIDDLLLKLN
jgi:hypothetical protein